MQTHIILAFSLLLSCPLLAADNAEDDPALGGGGYRIPYPQLRAAADKYLRAHATPEEIEGMRRKLRERVETRKQDNPHTQEDTIMRSIMLDWAAANQGKLRQKETKAILQACFYSVIFIDKNYLMPWQFREQLDEKTVKEILDYLEAHSSNPAAGKDGE